MNPDFILSLIKRPALLPKLYFLPHFNNKTGIVIGGKLRWHFAQFLKTAGKVIYVDNCPADLDDTQSERYLTDAADLSFAPDQTIDFVASSHVFEHITNPLKAITEWKRVLKPDGIIYVAVPDKRHSIDSQRPRTPLSHLIDDFNNNVDPSDKTHFDEAIQQWNHPHANAKSKEHYTQLVLEKPESRVHHHVWIDEDIKDIFHHMKLKILLGPTLRHGTIHIAGQKL